MKYGNNKLAYTHCHNSANLLNGKYNEFFERDFSDFKTVNLLNAYNYEFLAISRQQQNKSTEWIQLWVLRDLHIRITVTVTSSERQIY